MTFIVQSYLDTLLRHVLSVTLGSLRIDDFRTTSPLGHVIVLRSRPVEI